MDKAEERAFEAHPDYRAMDGGYVSQRKTREMFSKGYHQAEKDLAPTAQDRGMVEEIIIHLKRVESDYHIDLTREIEWLRSKAQKGE